MKVKLIDSSVKNNCFRVRIKYLIAIMEQGKYRAWLLQDIINFLLMNQENWLISSVKNNWLQLVKKFNWYIYII